MVTYAKTTVCGEVTSGYMYIHVSVCGVVHGDMIARPTPTCLYIHLMCECEVVTGHIHTHSCAVLPVLVR